MELRHLRYFLAVAEEGGFHAAAERLHLTEPPLLRQVKALEAELGTALLVREGRRIRLTSAGEYLRAGARALVTEADALMRRTTLAGGAPGRVRLGCVGSMMYSFFPELVAFLSRFDEALRFEILELSTEDQARALAMGDIDLGFLRDWAPRPGLTYRPLGEERLAAIYPRCWNLAAEHPTLADFSTRPFVAGTGAGLAGRIAEACARSGFSPQKTYECSQFSSILRLVAAGLGWSVVPAEAVRDLHVEGLDFVELEDRLPFGAAFKSSALPEREARLVDAAARFAAERLKR